MKILLVAFLLSLISSVAYAEDSFVIEKPVLCSTPRTVIEALSGSDFQEDPIWTGNNDEDRYVLMVNKKTKTWTIVQFNSNTACIVGSGTNHKPVILKQKIY